MDKKGLSLIIISVLILFNLDIRSQNSAIEPTNLERNASDFVEVTNNFSASQVDSLFAAALLEYENQQYQKTRNLCELANQLNPSLAITHILIGRSYIASIDSCRENQIKEANIWVAFDEWEKAIEKGNSSEAKMLMERYSHYLPSSEHLKKCFAKKEIHEGQSYFVECWIQRETRMRFSYNH